MWMGTLGLLATLFIRSAMLLLVFAGGRDRADSGQGTMKVSVLIKRLWSARSRLALFWGSGILSSALWVSTNPSLYLGCVMCRSCLTSEIQTERLIRDLRVWVRFDPGISRREGTQAKARLVGDSETTRLGLGRIRIGKSATP